MNGDEEGYIHTASERAGYEQNSVRGNTRLINNLRRQQEKIYQEQIATNLHNPFARISVIANELTATRRRLEEFLTRFAGSYPIADGIADSGKIGKEPCALEKLAENAATMEDDIRQINGMIERLEQVLS